MKPKTQVFRRSKSLTDLATNTQQTRSNLAEKAENNNANETVPKGKRQIYKVVPSTDPVHLDHSTHYSRGNRMAVTSAGNKCVYKWFEQRKNRRADGTEAIYYHCSACKSLKKDPKYVSSKNVVPQKVAVKTNDGVFWAVENENKNPAPHFCVAMHKDESKAQEMGRIVKHQLATGNRRSIPSSALTSVQAEVSSKFAKKGKDVLTQRNLAALGKSKDKGLRNLKRARYHYYKKVKSFADLRDNPALGSYRITYRATNCQEGDMYFNEKMLHYADDDMAIFFAEPQVEFLRASKYLFCDGSFKYAPARVHQVYRIFGLMLLEDGSYAAYPFVTALLHGKDEEIYKKLFIQVRDRLQTCEKQVRWKGALMDCEIAAVKSFHKILTKEFGVKPFMCAFHVKSALNKYISQIGLQEEYRQFESIQTCVRMIGALQFLDPDLYEQADAVILATIDQEIFDPVWNDQLNQVYTYYKKQWLSLDKNLGFDFFSLFTMHKNGPRTNDIAESYHSKLSAFYSRKSRLGVWIADFLRRSNTEINICEELIAGIYTGSQHNAVTKAINKKIMAAKEKLRDVIGDTTANVNHHPAITDFLATVGFAMGMKPDKCKKNIGIDGKEQKPKKKRKVPKKQNAADGTVPKKQNADDGTAENSIVKEPQDGDAQAEVTQITPQSRKRKSNNSSIIIENQLKRAKENRQIRYVPLAATEQKKLCSQFFLTYRENTALNLKARNFRSEWGMPLRSIKIVGDGNCYYRALSVRVTGSEMNHEGLRKAIMCFGEARKMEDPLIAQLYEITEITPSKRKTAATGHKDTDHYARFPLDFVLAAKCLQVNIIVYNDDHEWEVYRPDATSCRPLVEVPQEEIPSIALEYNCDHVTLVNTIG